MEENMISRKRKRKKGKKIVLILAAALIAGLSGFAFYKRNQAKDAAASVNNVQTAIAARMDISSELTASSSLSPKDTYEVTSLVEGEVLEALFEEGDVVEKGQVLYRIDASSMDTDLSSAETSLQRAKESLETAREDYDEAQNSLSGNTYKATGTGYLKTIYLKEGDKVGNGTKIADVYDDSIMKLSVPFLSAEADQIPVGGEAVLTLEDTGEQITGTVTAVSSMEEALAGGRLVKAVTIETANPGGLTTLTRATAAVGEFVCGGEGTFTPKTEVSMSADFPGQSNLEVETLLVAEGAYVTVGTPLFTVTAKSAQKYLKSFEDSLQSAGDSVENAQNKLSNTRDSIEDYTITAPISGTVITKNVKAGDKITKSANGTTAMAVIYDLSAMTLSMSVDELDVGSVKAGQQVNITAEALEGETFTGTVTNVSLESSYSNGVTNYPVTVLLDETGDLLPGMNVDAEIVLDSSKDALCIPVGALMRGNRVYVKNSLRDKSNDSGGEKDTGESDGAGPGAGNDAVKEDKGADGRSPVESRGSRERVGEQDQKGLAQSQGNAPDGFTVVTVETGIINDDYVEILSGLSEGDEVYVDPSAGSTVTNTRQMGGPGGPMGGYGGGPMRENSGGGPGSGRP